SNEILLLRTGNDRTARAANTRVNYDQVHCSRRKIGVGLRQSKCAVENVKCLDRVADVHDLGIGNDLENDALHGANEMIVQPEVGGQSNDRTMRHSASQVSLS